MLTGSASCRPPPELHWGTQVGVLPPSPSAAKGGSVPCHAELEEGLGLFSGTITTTFSLQIRAELLLASPLLLASHCFLDLLLFSARISTACPQHGLGLGPGGLCLARQSLLRLCRAWACPGLVLPCWQLNSPQPSFAGMGFGHPLL